jgi:hypothetical protein
MLARESDHRAHPPTTPNPKNPSKTPPGLLGRRRARLLRQLPLRLPPRVHRIKPERHVQDQALDLPAPRVLRVRAQHGKGGGHAAAV